MSETFVDNNIAISINDISKTYRQKIAIKSLSIVLEKNKIYGLIGRNGSGKSTLLNIISDEEQATHGNVTLSSDANVGIVSSTKGYPNFISLGGISSLFKASHKKWDVERYKAVLNIFALDEKRKYGDLSTGEAAGVKLAAMLAQKPNIWLLDEATLGIDIFAHWQCLTTLLEYFIEDQPCVLFCTHELSEIDRLAEEVIIMDSGKIYWQGDKDELIIDHQSLSETIFSMFEKLQRQSA